MKTLQAICLFFLFAPSANLAMGSQLPKTSEWSQPDQGIRGRLIVSNDDDLFNGTKVPTIFVEIENVSDIMTPLQIYYDPYRSFQCSLVDKQNRGVETAGLPASILTPLPFVLTLPWRGTIRFPVSVSGYGIPANAGVLISLPCGDWLIKKDDPAEYFLRATFKSTPAPPEEKFTGREWHGSLKLPDIKINP